MRLQNLATAVLIAAVGTATLVTAVGAKIWHETRASMSDVDALVDVRDGAYRIDVAIRYLNHLRVEPGILRGLVVQSARLNEMLEAETHPRADSARLHLAEIESLAGIALESHEPEDFDETAEQQRLRPLIDQMRIHESGALESLHVIIDDRNRETVAVLMRSLGLLLVIALAVVVLGFVVFWIVFHRIRRPLGAFSRAVSQFGSGASDVRVELEYRDELGDVAELFNQAMDQREKYQAQLKERIKEQRCLYGVLELTTDDARSVNDVCREIARLIPRHMLHEGAAAARVRLNGDEFASGAWAESSYRMASPVRIHGDEVGEVGVAYVGELPAEPGGEGPFLAEERTMLDSIAMHVARMLKDRNVSESLARSQRMQAVGELTGGIAHDFNNLLTVIQGNAEMLQESLGEGETDSKELVQMIDTAAHRGSQLTRQLLAFARRQALEPQSIRIEQQLEEMQGLLQRTLGSHIEFELKLAPDLWHALIDPTQLETAVLNLVVNARDAMPQGGCLTIETANVHLDRDYADSRPDVTPGDYVLVAVSDTGTGIVPQIINRVFEPFFTTKEKGRGTGLGLSMVYGFIKQSRGHVAVYSEPGEGTTVRLYLPRSHGAEIEPEVEVQSPVERGDATILLVEDDDLVSRYAQDQLRALGYTVRVAGNGPDAVEILKRDETIDLLLTDVVMPGGMSGRDLAEAATALRPGMKVLYMSGYTENAIVHHGRLDPGVNLLTKPFGRADLARKVHQALAGGSPEDGDH